MNRSPVQLRPVSEEDAPRLAELWSEVLRRTDVLEQTEDLSHIIKQALAATDERIVVAEYDGEFAGAIHLRTATLTPLNLEPVVQAMSPTVLPQFRRRGIGRALMEAAVAYAEELGIGHVAASSVSKSRDGNRFLARLGLGPQAILRCAPDPRRPRQAQCSATRNDPRQSPARPGAGQPAHPAPRTRGR